MTTRRILKYLIWGTSYLPLGPEDKVLHVAEQRGEVFLWAEVDTTVVPEQPRAFVILPTGETVPEGHQHVGSVVMANLLVWHVYEVLPAAI